MKYNNKEELMLVAVNNGDLYRKYNIGDFFETHDILSLEKNVIKLVDQQVQDYYTQFNEKFYKKDIEAVKCEIVEYYLETAEITLNLEVKRIKNSYYGNPNFEIMNADNAAAFNYLIKKGNFIETKKGIKTRNDWAECYGFTNVKGNLINGIKVFAKIQ